MIQNKQQLADSLGIDPGDVDALILNLARNEGNVSGVLSRAVNISRATNRLVAEDLTANDPQTEPVDKNHPDRARRIVTGPDGQAVYEEPPVYVFPEQEPAAS